MKIKLTTPKKILDDESEMPWGPFRGRKMKAVPASYLDMIEDDLYFIKALPEVIDYIERNRKLIDRELKEAGLL